MPIYEYRCESCEHVFEEIQRFSDPDPESCPQCGKSPVRRLISNSSFQLKGGGWYESNYESTPSKSSASAGGGAGSSSGSAASPKSTDAA